MEGLPEARRLAYLEAMGVISYFPVVSLPGAPASRLCATAFQGGETDGAPSPTEAILTPGIGEPAPKTGGDILRDLVPPVDRSPKPNKSPVATAAQPSEKTEKVAFSLRFIQSPGVALIVDSSPRATPESALQRFAANLLTALSSLGDGDERQVEVQSHLFRWPVAGGAGSAQIDQGEQAAREAVQAAVAANCERCNITRVVVMGETAAQFSGELPGLSPQTFPAIAHYLMEPLAKRELWQVLRSE